MKEVLSINDLKEKDEDGGQLDPKQRLALKNFDRFRFSILSTIKNEGKWHKEYQRLQSMANLSDYREFLKDEYL